MIADCYNRETMGMMKRFGIAFLLIMVYMGLWAIPLAIVAMLVDEDVLVWVILGITFVLISTFPIVIDRIGKLAFSFKGTGAPIASEDLCKQIMEINFHDLPIIAEEKGKNIIVTWKYLDAKWWEIMSKQGRQESFKLIIKFDEKRHRVTLIDVITKMRWGAGPSGVRFGFSFFRGIYLNYSLGAAWGIKENFTLGKIYDFKFSSEEIHNPVMNTILRSGWDVRLGCW